MHNAFNLEIPGLHKHIGHDVDVLALFKRMQHKIELNNNFGPIGRPDGGIQFDAPLFDIQHIGRGLRRNIRILPTWNFADFMNGPALVPDKPALRLKQHKARDNEGLAIKGNDLVFKPARHIHIASDFDALVNDVRFKRKKAKADGLKQLQGFWKAAQGPKDGIGYGHPAHKGFFAAGHVGRNHKWCMRPEQFERREPIRRKGLFSGLRGVHEINNLCMDINPWGAGFFEPRAITPTNERIERQLRRQLEELRRQLEHNDWMRARKQRDWNARSYIKIKLKWLDEPGANICQIIADVYAHSKSNDCEYSDLIGNELEHHGFTQLGNGHFSRAYKGPDGSVYKVNCNNTSHDAWYVYGLNCMYYGQGLDCLPTIDSIAYSGTTYCVKMGLLSPITRDEFYENYSGLNDAFRSSGDVSDVMRIMGVTRQDAIDLMSIVDRTKRETPGSRFDIHHENVMHRIDANGNKTLVLTDPLAYGDFVMSDFDHRLAACNAIASNVPQLAKAA